MAHLISNVNKINKYINANVFDHFLAPKLFLDSPYMVTPKVLDSSKSKYLLYREQETGNVDLLNFKHINRIPHNPYFLVGEKKEQNKIVHASFIKAITEILNRDEKENILEIDNNLPFNLFQKLMNELQGYELRSNNSNGITMSTEKYKIYEVETKKVINKFNDLKKNSQSYSKKLISDIIGEKNRQILEKGITRINDSRYNLLNNLMNLNHLKALIFHSKINIQELTGKYFKEHDKVCAIYRYLDDKVFIISENEINDPMFIKNKESLRFFESLRYLKIGKNRIGFEDHYLSIFEYNEFLENNYQLIPATIIFRKWREYRAGEDISFYLIAGKASKYAMEKVLENALGEINKGIFCSEKRLFLKYLNYFNEFKKIHELPYFFNEYFTNFYYSDRTLYPSIPSDYIVNSKTNQLKIDAGILMSDKDGLILGSSDIARTLPILEISKKPYKVIKDCIINNIIPEIGNAKTFDEIYYKGIKMFSEKCENILIENGICPSNFNIIDEFDRDIGHLWGKQESFDEKIYKNNKHILNGNTVGCIELQWQYKDHTLVYEDMWYFGKEGISNITL